MPVSLYPDTVLTTAQIRFSPQRDTVLTAAQIRFSPQRDTVLLTAPMPVSQNALILKILLYMTAHCV